MMRTFLKQNLILIFIIILFSAVSLALIINSTNLRCVNLACPPSFSEWQMHDALWHISVANLSFDAYPFTNPLMEGTLLSGYNYGFDLLLNLLSRVGINAATGYFLIIPLTTLLLFIRSALIYVRVFAKSKFEQLSTLILLFFGTSFYYLVNLKVVGTLAGSTLRGFPVVSSLYPASMFLNLPYALSLPLLLWLIMILRSVKSRTSWLWLTCLIFILFGLKFYAGVTALLLTFFLPKKDLMKRVLCILIGTVFAYLLFYQKSSPASPFALAPLAIPHVIFDDVNLLYNHTLTLARYFLYENLSNFPVRLILIESATILTFLLLNWGTRIIGYILVINKSLRDRYTTVLLGLSLILSSVPILFVQNGGWYNTMQFMYYAVFLLSLATAKLLSNLYKAKPTLALVLFISMFLPLIPSTLEQLRYYQEPQVTSSIDEWSALITLKNKPWGTVHVNRPWAKRALIPALTNKKMFYLDTDQLMLFVPNYESRLKLVRQFEGGSITQIPADYYFIYKEEVASPDSYLALSKSLNLNLLFDSQTIAIFAQK